MDPKDRKQTWMVWYVVIAFLAVAALQQIWTTLAQTETMPYSQFEQLVSAKQVSDVVISANAIQGTLKSPLADGKSSSPPSGSIRRSPISSKPPASR